MDPAPPIRWCRKGHAELASKFYTLYKDKSKPRFSSYCVICDKKAMRERDRQSKLQVMVHYGRICQCCSEGHEEFLTIDHIDGGGSQHRKEIGGNGSNLYGWLIRNGFPPGFRVLCFNCNLSLGMFGYCPHQREIS